MAFLGDLLVRLRAETADFQQDLGKAITSTERAANKINRVLGGIGAGISIVGMTAFIKSGIDAADNLNKLSQKVGVSVESLSAYQYAAKLADTSNETLSVSFARLAKNAADAQTGTGDAKEAFKALGISVVDGSKNLKSTEALMLEIADRFSRIEDGAGKTALAMKIFGRSGMELIPFLNAGADGLQRMREEASAFGAVITSKMAKDAEEFNDNIARLASSIDKLKVALAGGVLDALGDFAERMVLATSKTGGLIDGIVRSMQVASFGATLGEQIRNISKELERLDKLEKSAGLSALERDEQARKRVMLDLARAEQRRQALALGAGIGRDERQRYGLPDPKPKERAPAIPVAGMTAAQELKLFTSAMQGLEKQYGALTNAGQKQQLIYETEKGSLKVLTEEHKKALVAFADKIDVYKRAEEAAKDLAAIEDQRIAREQTINEVASAQLIAYSQTNKEMEFQTSLIGKTIDEQERLNAVREIELDVLRRLAALPQGEDDAAESARAANEILNAAEKQKAAVLEGIRVRLEAERSWVTGSSQAMDEYLRKAADSAAQASSFFGNLFRGMEDAIVSLLKTGKLNFKALADSIISDLIRIYVQKQIMGPIIEGIGSGGGLFGGLFGGGGGGVYGGEIDGTSFAVGGSFATGTDFVPRDMMAKVHRGEAIIPAAENLGGGSGKDGGTFYIDARGADAAKIMQLEKMIYQLNGSIERRAVAANIDHRRRGG